MNNVTPKDTKSKVNATLQYFNSKKKQALKIACFYENLGMSNKYKAIRKCTDFVFINKDTGKCIPFTCKQRLCPVCQSQYGYRKRKELEAILEDDSVRNKPLIFITLTIKNCSADDLPRTLDILFKAMNKLTYNKAKKAGFYKYFDGFYRVLEITYNSKENTYHPHFHILSVGAETYGQNGSVYLSHENLMHIWQQALQVNYEPSVRIEKVTDTEKSVKEICKYTTKDGEIKTDRVLKTLDTALKNRRINAYFGTLKEIQAKVKETKKQEQYKDIFSSSNTLVIHWDGEKQNFIEKSVDKLESVINSSPETKLKEMEKLYKEVQELPEVTAKEKMIKNKKMLEIFKFYKTL